jgi:hypothetical protein
MTYQSQPFHDVVRCAPPGLEVVEWLVFAASNVSPAGRLVLSHAAASLLNRGWLPSMSSLVEQAQAHGDHDNAALEAGVVELERAGLLVLDGGKVLELGGAISTKPTGWVFAPETGNEVHLVGPLAAFGVAQALGHPGVVRGRCAVGAEPLELHCDTTGVHTRAPETLAMFLPVWDGVTAPGGAVTAGMLFHSDDALSEWQAGHGDPDGLPLASFVFPFATTDLGERVGKALESLFDALATFD